MLDIHKVLYNKVDGEQDFILFPGTINEKYIELKSISLSLTSVSLTPEQAKKAIVKGASYFLCVIPNSGDYNQFSIDDFLKTSKFTNELKEALGKHIMHAETFEKSDNGITGEYPKLLLNRLRAKPYYLKVDEAAWGGINFMEFIGLIS